MPNARLTEEQFAALLAARQMPKICAKSPATAPQPAKPAQQRHLIRQTQRGPNKSEMAFANEVLYWRKLRNEVERYEFEPIRLRLANGVTYTPDWCAWLRTDRPRLGQRLTFYEVKGEKRQGRTIVRDDASAKIKIAATQYPEFQFVLVWKDQSSGQWQEQPVLQ